MNKLVIDDNLFTYDRRSTEYLTVEARNTGEYSTDHWIWEPDTGPEDWLINFSFF